VTQLNFPPTEYQQTKKRRRNKNKETNQRTHTKSLLFIYLIFVFLSIFFFFFGGGGRNRKNLLDFLVNNYLLFQVVRWGEKPHRAGGVSSG
jgi:hypothetical protein